MTAAIASEPSGVAGMQRAALKTGLRLAEEWNLSSGRLVEVQCIKTECRRSVAQLLFIFSLATLYNTTCSDSMIDTLKKQVYDIPEFSVTSNSN